MDFVVTVFGFRKFPRETYTFQSQNIKFDLERGRIFS